MAFFWAIWLDFSTNWRFSHSTNLATLGTLPLIQRLMIKMSYEDMAMFILDVAFYLLEQNRQNRILRMFYFPPVAFMARNSEMRIAILGYFANMY